MFSGTAWPGLRVLARNQSAIDHRLGGPVLRGLDGHTTLVKLSFQQERHDLKHLHVTFFGIGERSPVLALHKVLAVGHGRLRLVRVVQRRGG